jgi:hypothetical protein
MLRNENKRIFDEVVTGLCKKVKETPETIFTESEFIDDLQVIEESFIATVGEFNYMNAKPYDQRKMIKQFFEESYLSQYYTLVYDSLLMESELTFSQQYLLENTQNVFKVTYLGENESVVTDTKLLEEGFLNPTLAGSTVASIGMFLHLPLMPLAAISAAAVLAADLLVPVASSAKKERWASSMLGKVGKLLVSSKPFYIKSGSPISQSISNIANFDNLNLNSEVTKMFAQLQKSTNKDGVQQGIKELFSHCNDVLGQAIQDNPNLSTAQIDKLSNSKYNPETATIIGMFYNSIMRSADNGDIDSVLMYRKCLIDKLVDVYKYLVIANAVNSKDYLKIARSLARGNGANPEQLFSFVSSASELDTSNTTELLRENLITLLKLRLEFDNLAQGLSRGAFKVDTEAGKYFTGKLKQVDLAVEDYLRTHGKKIDTLYENRREFEKKDFKHNPVTVKKSLFGFDRGNQNENSGSNTRPYSNNNSRDNNNSSNFNNNRYNG